MGRPVLGIEAVGDIRYVVLLREILKASVEAVAAVFSGGCAHGKTWLRSVLGSIKSCALVAAGGGSVVTGAVTEIVDCNG